MTEEKMKRCNKGEKCVTGEAYQPLTNFSKRSVSPDGHTYTCKKCEAFCARESYHRRKDPVKQKEYYEKNKDKRREYHKDYYSKNKDKKKEYDAKYQLEGKGKEVMKKAHAKRREALKDGRVPYQRHEVIARDSVDGILICQLCTEPIARLSDLHVDHILPIAKGGKDVIENVRCTHKDCNLIRPKDGRDLDEEVGDKVEERDADN